LRGLVPRIGDGVFVLLRYGEAERARRELEQAPTLSIFGFRDHGALLQKDRQDREDGGRSGTSAKVPRFRHTVSSVNLSIRCI
jgi:hypothetical protein